MSRKQSQASAGRALIAVVALSIAFVGIAAEGKAASEDVCIVTHYQGEARQYGDIAAANQASYARKWGFRHHAYTSRVSGDRYLDPRRGPEDHLFGGGLFWQKVAAVDKTLNEGLANAVGQYSRCEWVVWMDSDAMFTNFDISLTQIIDDWANVPFKRKELIFTTERDHPINAGVFFVRNSEAGRGFITALGALYPLYLDSCLPEQTALASIAYVMEPWPSCVVNEGITPELHPLIALAPQRTFDSFHSPIDFGETANWQRGDFIAHFAGNERHLRPGAMRALLEELRLPQ